KDPNHRPKSAFELLLPEDGSRPVDVRFVADRNGATATRDDVLRIEDESVFYIGPNTWPTRQPAQTWRERLVGRRRQAARPAASPVRPAVAQRPASPPPARPVPPPAPPIPAKVVTVPPPPPAPAPLPDARVRVAELATSMLA